MNRRFVSVLIFALVVSATASVILYRLISAKLTANAGTPTTKIVVAAHNLDVGAIIAPADVALADWAGDPPQGAFTKTEDVVNRGVVSNMYSGEALVDSRLAAKGAGGGLAATIPPGMRAVAIRVNEVVGVSGFVLPGMHVDIIIAGNPPHEGVAVGTMTKTILQNIEVLSAGSNIQHDTDGKPVSVAVVNLLVTPEQAEVLSLASSEMRLQLVLRNPMDKEIAKTTGTAVANLFSGASGLPVDPAPAPASEPRKRVKKEKPAEPPPPPPPAPVVVVAPPPPPAPPPPITVEVFHGTKKTESSFPGQEKKP